MDAVREGAPIPVDPPIAKHPNTLWHSLATLILESEDIPGGDTAPLQDAVRQILIAQMGHVAQSNGVGDTQQSHHQQKCLWSAPFAAGYRAVLHAYEPHRTGVPEWSPAVSAAFWSDARTAAMAVMRQDHPTAGPTKEAAPPASLCHTPSEEIAPRNLHIGKQWVGTLTGQGPESKSKKRGRSGPHRPVGQPYSKPRRRPIGPPMTPRRGRAPASSSTSTRKGSGHRDGFKTKL